MAFSDFDLNGSQATVLHSAPPLNTNPLAVGGTYCRRLDINAGQYSKIYYKTTAYGGTFYNTPNTKVLSLRAHVRKEGNAGIWLTAKDSATFASNTINGYSFGIGNDLRVMLRGAGLATPTIITTDSNPAGLATSAWYSLRMDIFSLGALGDRIICYMEVASSGSSISSPGSGIWNNIIGGYTFDAIIGTSDSKFVPWSNNGRCGIHRDNGSGAAMYLDNINFSTYTAPV
jgi:hypothetical protein